MFIIKNLFTWRWRLKSTKINSWETGDPREPMCVSCLSHEDVRTMSESWRTWELMMWIPVWKPTCSRPKKRAEFSLYVLKQEKTDHLNIIYQEFPSTCGKVSLFDVLWLSTDWINPPQWGGPSALLSLLIQMLISYKNALIGRGGKIAEK